MSAFSAHIFDTMTDDDERWRGLGYLGERRIALSSEDSDAPPLPERVAATDERILQIAAERGWSYDQLFAWANSKNGRWLADIVLGDPNRPFDDAFGSALTYLRLPDQG